MEAAPVTPRHAARRAAWVALALALVSLTNAIVTARIVLAEDYDRFVPPPVVALGVAQNAIGVGVRRPTYGSFGT